MALLGTDMRNRMQRRERRMNRRLVMLMGALLTAWALVALAIASGVFDF